MVICRDLKQYWMLWKSMFMLTINYLKVIGCEYIAAKELYVIKVARETLWISAYKPNDNNGTDVTFEGE